MRDPEELRYKKYAQKKPFGIQSWSEFSKKWRTCRWYATEKAREQGLDDYYKKCEAAGLTIILRKVER